MYLNRKWLIFFVIIIVAVCAFIVVSAQKQTPTEFCKSIHAPNDLAYVKNLSITIRDKTKHSPSRVDVSLLELVNKWQGDCDDKARLIMHCCSVKNLTCEQVFLGATIEEQKELKAYHTFVIYYNPEIKAYLTLDPSPSAQDKLYTYAFYNKQDAIDNEKSHWGKVY